MENFTALFHELESTTSTDLQVKSLVTYFQSVSKRDALWTISLLIGNRPKRVVLVSLLREWASEISDIPYWLFEESFQIIGDLAETIAILHPSVSSSKKYSLEALILAARELSARDVIEQKQTIYKIWDSLQRDERILFNKIITGGFNIGIPKKTIIKALAQHLNLAEAVVSHRLINKWTPESTSFTALLVEKGENEDLSKPYPFCNAYELERPADDLGLINDWSAEYKWSGIRAQIIKRQGELFVWTVDEDLVTDRFPEFMVLKEVSQDDFVLDGEIVGWQEEKVLPLALLQKRLTHKAVSKKLLTDVPILFIAYDLLESAGVDQRYNSYTSRRQALEEVISQIGHDSFQLSDEIAFSSWHELTDTRNNARIMGSEGVVLKKRESTYREGRHKGDWWKWKADPLKVNAVLLYATRGAGGSNSFKDFTFAVHSGDQLVPFTKASSGLTEDEISEIAQFVKENTIEKFGPVRSVTAELVFEISFDGISKSTRHKSGLVLRSPLISKWRKDQVVNDANTLEDLHRMLELYA